MDSTLEDRALDWAAREAYWRRRLRRLRFDAEPIEEQLARQFRVTQALTLIPGGIGVMFLAIFGAFGRVDVGAGVVGVLILPVVSWAWVDYAILRSRALRYLGEWAEYKKQLNAPPG